MSKKIALILGASPEDAPYLKYYTDVFDRESIEYDIICWDRRNNAKEAKNRFVFHSHNFNNHYLAQLSGYWGFRRVVLSKTNKINYDGFILVGLQWALFLNKSLFHSYKNKYIIDIRDYSNIYKHPVLKRMIDSVLKKSFFVCISSLGFKSWLPSNNEYVLSHNIDINLVDSVTPASRRGNGRPKVILTIGQLRDYDITCKFISRFLGSQEYELVFAGDGVAYIPLKRYVEDNQIENVRFLGRYEKLDELKIVEECDYINIFLPNDTLSIYLTSNRFYLSVLMKKPMIVNNGSYQAELASKYGLGVCTTLDTLHSDLKVFQREFVYEEYMERCHRFLNVVKIDETKFESKVVDFINAI